MSGLPVFVLSILCVAPRAAGYSPGDALGNAPGDETGKGKISQGEKHMTVLVSPQALAQEWEHSSPVTDLLPACMLCLSRGHTRLKLLVFK